uniref:Uncharacterized protein n=1 Tax=Brassica oleracea TaxID=3712 RepID=A0A3P6F4I7_BRAOL|nr:unnamed protein product [Brassica oleracea]
MVSHHASNNHIHFLKDGNENFLYGVEDIKAHAADYFQGILGSTDLHFSSATTNELRNMLPFRCSELQQNYLKQAFFKVVDRCTRDRLLSLPSVTAASPSLLELYFWFVFPYS